MARHNDLLDSALVGEHFPILQDAERVIADPIVRNRGTVGGSLCQADPAEDLSAALSALHATATIRGADGARTVPVARTAHRSVRDGRRRRRDPHRDPGPDPKRLRQRLREGRAAGRRLGDRLRRRRRLDGWRHHHRRRYRVGRRRRRTLRLAGSRGGAAGNQCRPTTSSPLLLPRHRPIANPTTDQRGPAEYKRHLAGELTARALRRAVARANGGN